MRRLRHIAPLALCLAFTGPALARSVTEVLALLDQAGKPDAVLEAAGLPSLPLPPARPGRLASAVTGAPVVELADLRLALMQLALQAGTNNQLALLNAQADPVTPKALVLRSGKVSLSELGDLVRASGATGISGEGSQWTLSLPLVIWQDAALEMKPGESLVIDRASGAFLLSFGGLALTSASITGTEAENPRAPDFRPFVLVAGAGTVQLDRATLAALGFGDSAPFGGLTIANSGLFKPDFGPRISASTFDDVTLVALEGSVGTRIDTTEFTGASLLLTGVADAQLSRNTFSEGAGTAALTLDKASVDVTLTGNRIATADGMGLLIDGLSRRVRLIGNVIDESGGVGINIRHSACLIAVGNLVARSTSSGIRLTRTGKAWFSDNALIANRSAGLDLVDQSGGAPVVLNANWLAANTVGLKGGEIGSVLLSDNDLSGQFPRQFGGGFAPHLASYLAVAEGAARPGDYTITDLRAGPVAASAPLTPIDAGTPWPADCQEN